MHKHAIVTGCSSGIGEAVTLQLLREGWSVTGISRRTYQVDNERFTHQMLDVSDAGALTNWAQAYCPKRVDAIIHAAGILRVGTLAQIEPAEGLAMWKLHVEAPALLAKHLTARLTKGGRIVLIGSRVSAGAAGKSFYAASKSAQTGLVRSIAKELPRQHL